MRQAEAKLVAALPPPETTWKVYCKPSIRERRQRDYLARVAYREALEKGLPPPPPPSPPPPPPPIKQVETPPSPTDIAAFPVFGDAPLTLLSPPKWEIQGTQVRTAPPPVEKTQLKLDPVKEPVEDEGVDTDWDSDCEEEWERFVNEEDLVVFE